MENTLYGYGANRNSMITERKGPYKGLFLHQGKSLREHGRLAGLIYALKSLNFGQDTLALPAVPDS